MVSRGGTSQVTVRLDPPDLGEVTVRLVSDNRVLSGEIIVQNRQVHELVQGRIAELRESLSSQGVQVDQIQVSVDGRGAAGTQRDTNPFNFREDAGGDRPDGEQPPDQSSDRWGNPSRGNPGRSDGRFDTTA